MAIRIGNVWRRSYAILSPAICSSATARPGVRLLDSSAFLRVSSCSLAHAKSIGSMSIETSNGRSPSRSGAAQSVTIVGGSLPRSKARTCSPSATRWPLPATSTTAGPNRGPRGVTKALRTRCSAATPLRGPEVARYGAARPPGSHSGPPAAPGHRPARPGSARARRAAHRAGARQPSRQLPRRRRPVPLDALEHRRRRGRCAADHDLDGMRQSVQHCAPLRTRTATRGSAGSVEIDRRRAVHGTRFQTPACRDPHSAVADVHAGQIGLLLEPERISAAVLI